MLDKFIQQAERDYEDGVAAEIAAMRKSNEARAAATTAKLKDVLESNLDSDLYRALDLRYEYDIDKGYPYAAFNDGDDQYHIVCRNWDDAYTDPELRIIPNSVPPISQLYMAPLKYKSGNLTTNLLLYIKECRNQIAERAAYQKQQADNLAEIERKAAERQAESDHQAELFRARQVEGNAVKERVITEARTFMASSKALFAPVTVYKWTWAVAPAVYADGECQDDGQRDEGWSTQYQGDDEGWVTLWQDGRARVLRMTAYNLPVIERITINNWADCPDELTELVYAAMPDGWHMGYDHGYGWQQKGGESYRVDVGSQPCAWLRAIAYGEPGQRCACGQDGTIYVDGLWRCYDCWQRPRADVGSEDLPF